VKHGIPAKPTVKTGDHGAAVHRRGRCPNAATRWGSRAGTQSPRPSIGAKLPCMFGSTPNRSPSQPRLPTAPNGALCRHRLRPGAGLLTASSINTAANPATSRRFRPYWRCPQSDGSDPLWTPSTRRRWSTVAALDRSDRPGRRELGSSDRRSGDRPVGGERGGVIVAVRSRGHPLHQACLVGRSLRTRRGVDQGSRGGGIVGIGGTAYARGGVLNFARQPCATVSKAESQGAGKGGEQLPEDRFRASESNVYG